MYDTTFWRRDRFKYIALDRAAADFRAVRSEHKDASLKGKKKKKKKKKGAGIGLCGDLHGNCELIKSYG